MNIPNVAPISTVPPNISSNLANLSYPILSYAIASTSNHETLLCTVRTCFNCRDRGEHSTHLQSECKERLKREEYINSVSASAAKAAAAKAVQEVYLFYNDEDEEEYSDYSTDAP